jgi:hypothetical protein
MGARPLAAESRLLIGGELAVPVVGVTPPWFFGLAVGESFDMRSPDRRTERHRTSRDIVRELLALRSQATPSEKADPGTPVVQVADAAVLLLALEKFLRLLLGAAASYTDAVADLVEKAMSPSRNLLRLPRRLSGEQAIRAVWTVASALDRERSYQSVRSPRPSPGTSIAFEPGTVDDQCCLLDELLRQTDVTSGREAARA